MQEERRIEQIRKESAEYYARLGGTCDEDGDGGGDDDFSMDSQQAPQVR